MSREHKIHTICAGNNMGWVGTKLVSLADGCAVFKSTISDDKRAQVMDETTVMVGEALRWKLDDGSSFNDKILEGGGFVFFDLLWTSSDRASVAALIADNDENILWMSIGYPLSVNDSIGIRVGEVVWPGEEIAS